jgi:hypothetical protein
MIGCAAEIDDHLNRGRNMDTRTPASECRFVAQGLPWQKSNSALNNLILA